MTPKQFVQAIVDGKYNGGISASVVREDAKKALKGK